MARYRVGNKFLSEKEYRQHKDEGITLIIFLLGAGGAGILTHQYLVDAEWIKILRFTIVLGSSIIVGSIFVRFKHQLVLFSSMCLLLAFVVSVGGIIWEIV